MKQSNRKTVQKIAHKQTKTRSEGQGGEIEAMWSFLEDEPEIVHFQHEYEFAVEHRYFK